MVININPAFIPKVPGTGFSLPGQSLVPSPYQPNFQMLGNPYAPATPGLPAVIPKATIPGLEGLGVPEAVAAGEPAAAAIGRLASLLGYASSPLGLIGAGLGGALYNDPGSKKHFDPFLGINPNDEPDDLGITSIGKSALRGAAHGGNQISDGLEWLGKNSPLTYLTTPKVIRDAAAEPLGPQGGEVPLYGAKEEDSSSPDLSGLEWAIPQESGDTNAQMNSSLDDLMKVIAGQKPKETKLPEDLQFKQAVAGFLGGLDNSLPTNSGALAKATAGALSGSIKNQLQGLALEGQNTKAAQDWLESYAKTGVDVAKAKNEISKGDFKIHTGRNGFLVEMTENGKKILKPISANIFGPPAGSKMSIGSTKFESDNPLKSELSVLQNLHSVGILNDVLQENAKALNKASKGIMDPKQMQEAQVLALARAMHQNPQFKASMIQKYLSAIGKKPGVAKLDAPAQTDELDYLSALDNARKEE